VLAHGKLTRKHGIRIVGLSPVVPERSQDCFSGRGKGVAIGIGANAITDGRERAQTLKRIAELSD
jgi:hypothetical protein